MQSHTVVDSICNWFTFNNIFFTKTNKQIFLFLVPFLSIRIVWLVNNDATSILQTTEKFCRSVYKTTYAPHDNEGHESICH